MFVEQALAVEVLITQLLTLGPMTHRGALRSASTPEDPMLALLALAPLISLPPLVDNDSPQWGAFRGNLGAGHASGTRVPDSLDPEGNLAWRVELPGGYSSPTVAGDRVFLTGSEGEELLTLAVDLGTGEEIWRQSLPFDGKRPGANSPASPSPVTDGERVYVAFHSFGLAAYTIEGEALWRVEMEPFNIPHGLATSPVVHDGRVIFCVDQDGGGFVAAFDAATGEELWRTERPGVFHGYATPSLFLPADGTAQVVVAGSMQVAGYSVDEGKKLWWADVGAWQTKGIPVIAGGQAWVNSFMVTLNEAGLPRMSGTFEEALSERDEDGDGKISKDEWDDPQLRMAWFVIDLDDDGFLDSTDWDYITLAGSRTGGLYSIRLDGEGDVTESHVDWSHDDRRGLPDAASPLLVDGLLYLLKTGGILTALDADTGEVIKRERIGDSDQYYASPVFAEGRIVTASLGGLLTVVEAGAEWKVLSQTSVDEQVWSTPALADDRVLVRSQEALWCFGQADDED